MGLDLKRLGAAAPLGCEYGVWNFGYWNWKYVFSGTEDLGFYSPTLG